jgi:hypothetical protein
MVYASHLRNLFPSALPHLRASCPSKSQVTQTPTQVSESPHRSPLTITCPNCNQYKQVITLDLNLTYLKKSYILTHCLPLRLFFVVSPLFFHAAPHPFESHQNFALNPLQTNVWKQTAHYMKI